MGLKVWLPLNGDLENKGCSDITITNNGATIDNNGKIGRCYYFSGSSTRMYTSLFTPTSNNISIVCWLKMPTDITNSGYIFGLSRSSSPIFMLWNNGATDFRIYIDGSSRKLYTHGLSANEWHHLALTYNGTIAKLYIDGIEKTNISFSATTITTAASSLFIGCRSNNTNTDGTGTYFRANYFNDVRYYDHCLSAAEVKEISLGLILHYKLNNNNNNINRNLLRIGTNNFHNTNELTTVTWTGWDVYDSLPLTDMDWNNRYGEYITYSCYMENIQLTAGTGSGIMLHFRYADGTYSLYGGGKNGSTGLFLAQGECGWLKITVAIPNASTRSNPTTITRVEASIRHNTSGGVSTIKYQYPQVELGNKLTNWFWAPEDFDTNNLKIIDSSGYNNDGSIISSLQSSDESPRYEHSSSFDGIDDCITVPYNAICPENIFTFNLWFKKDALGSKGYETLFGGPGGFEMDTRAASASSLSLYMASTRSGNRNAITPLTLGNWYMITMTRDGTTEKYYVNGIFQSEIEAKSMPTGDYFIGAWKTSTLLNYYGLISDFRIYCTVLSEEDIKQLYNTAMKIDNLNNIHTFQLEEINGNQILPENCNRSNSNVTISFNHETNTYTLTIPDNSNGTTGAGIMLGTTHKLYFPWNTAYRLSMEVYSPVSGLMFIDYNNAADDMTDMSGNDNDVVSSRIGAVTIPANTWTLVNYGTINANETKNPNHRTLYDYSYFGLLNKSGSAVTYYIRNIRWYLVNDLHKLYLNGTFKDNQFIETFIHEKASLRNKEKCIEAIEFIEK